MLRTLITTAIIGCAGLTLALAQTAPLPFEALMREQGQAAYRELNPMVKGEAPFDKAKVEAALTKLSSTSSKINEAFAPALKGQKSADDRYIASAKIWENPADFTAKKDALAKVVSELLGKIDTLDSLKANYPKINGACEACHDAYRQRAS